MFQYYSCIQPAKVKHFIICSTDTASQYNINDFIEDSQDDRGATDEWPPTFHTKLLMAQRVHQCVEVDSLRNCNTHCEYFFYYKEWVQKASTSWICI